MQRSLSSRTARRVWRLPLLAALLLLDGSLFAFAGGIGEGAVQRTITVSGTGTVSAAPDIAVVRLGVETRNSDVKQALAEASTRMSALVSSLQGNGVVASDIQTVDYNVSFVASPREGAASAGRPTSPRPSAPPGYFRVADVASVTVRDLSRLGTILDDALSAGANEIQGISFQLADPAPLEKRARAAAYTTAHEHALQLAALSYSELGKVLRITSSGSPVAMAGSGLRAAALAPAVSPGQLEISVTLQVVYAIKR